VRLFPVCIRFFQGAFDFIPDKLLQVSEDRIQFLDQYITVIGSELRCRYSMISTLFTKYINIIILIWNEINRAANDYSPEE